MISLSNIAQYYLFISFLELILLLNNTYLNNNDNVIIMPNNYIFKPTLK